MSMLTASNLAKSYDVQVVFEGVSLSVPRGTKTALVGSNGSGKTTLLRLIAGLEEPTEGEIHRAGSLQIGYLPQHADLDEGGTLWAAMMDVFADLRAQADELRRLETAIADPATREEASGRYSGVLDAFEQAGGYAYQARTRQVLCGLGFDEDDFDRPVAQLSGGQRTRALMARLLLEDPDLLLLDEPTNHLDLEGVEWLEGYLQAWPGAIIVVAHDRAFLDVVVDRVWEIAWGSLDAYRGTYSDYARQRAERRARQQAEYEKQQAVIAHTEAFIRRNIAGQRTKEAQGRRKRLERMERIERPETYQPLHLDLGQAHRSGRVVLEAGDLAVGYEPDELLFTADELLLQRGERVTLLGANGSGKTSLVRTILGETPPLSGHLDLGYNVKVGYFAQGHTNLDPELSVLQTVLEAGSLGRSEARDLLAQYRFFDDDVFKFVGDLSGGERARVALAVLTLQGANLLILDEPTNHLDIPSQEVLQEALADFSGAMLIVTHDRYLIRALETRVWAIEDGRLRSFPGGYDAYREWKARRDRRRREERRSAGQTSYERARRAHRARQREEARRVRRQAKLEETIHALETQLETLEAQVARASTDGAVDEVRRLGDEYSRVEQALKSAMSDWLEVAGGE